MRCIVNSLDLSHGNGLEIVVKGFQHEPGAEIGCGAQVFVEIWEGKLRIHVWDGSSQDPQTTIIEPMLKEV